MRKVRHVVFEPFRLDVLDERLWKDGTCVPLGRKAFGVLARLVAVPDQLVTKDELLASVWPDTAVTEAVLTTAMREIRAAMGDHARTPHYVQTVHGRGYRFIAPVAEEPAPPGAVVSTSAGEALPVVGRDAERARLDQWFSAVRAGSRRIVFVAGEAGIGKTTLAEAFVTELAATHVVRVARGQCIEQYGAGEPYLPILEALGRLVRRADPFVERVLRQQAPGWLAHLPALAPGAAEPMRRVPAGRMLRELAGAVEGLAAAEPLVLLLEDLHWSDRATLEWVDYVTRRRDPAQLLVLGTYRPLEAQRRASPLRAVLGELRHLPQSGEIELDSLSGDAVRTYLRRRCGSVAEIEQLSTALHRRTGGHPLFLASLVDDLIPCGAAASAASALDASVVDRALPLNLRQFIEHRFELLPPDDRAILEAASVAGDPFSVAAVAAGTRLSEERIEARCEVLTHANRLFIADGVAAWPDGTLAARYRFRHALIQEAACARISSERRARLHHLIGLRLEQAFAAQVSAIAAELAVHFEQGRDPSRAVSFLEQAARNALHRSAYAEAHGQLSRALTLAGRLVDEGERQRREAALTLLLAQVLETRRGWAVEEVAQAYTRARELCLSLDDEPNLLQATWGLIAVSMVRAELRTTEALTHDVLRLAKKRGSTLFRMAAHAELGGATLVMGRTRAARRHFGLAEALCEPGCDERAIATFGMDMCVFARIWATHLTWYDGHPARAHADANEVLGVACRAGHPFTRTVTLAYAAMLSQFRDDLPDVDRLTGAAIADAAEHGFPYYLAWAQVLREWSRAAGGAGDGAVAGMRTGIDTLQAMAGLRLPYYRGLLADACGRIGRFEEGLDAIAAAFDDARRTGERWWDPELHRLRGDLLLRSAGAAHDAERCYRQAIDLARRQRARSLELRATASLARARRGRGRRAAGRL